MGLCNPSEKRHEQASGMGGDLQYRGSGSLHLPLGTGWQDKPWEKGKGASRRTYHLDLKDSGGGGALRYLLGKGRSPWTDPGLLCWEIRNRACSNPMLPSPTHTHELPTLPTLFPGSAEAWFATPALWITRRESAAARPAPRREMLNPTDGITWVGPPTAPPSQLPPFRPSHSCGLTSPAF